MTIRPDATDPDTINDIIGDQTSASAPGAYRLFNDPANDRYISPDFLLPS